MKNTMQNTATANATLKQFVLDGLSAIFTKREASKPLTEEESKEEKKEEWNYLLQLISL